MIQNLLNELKARVQPGKRLSFPQDIKVQTSIGPVYVKEIKNVQGNFMASIETRDDTAMKNVTQLDAAIIEAIANHMKPAPVLSSEKDI